MPDMTQNEPGRGGSGVSSPTSSERTEGVANELKGAAHDVAREARTAGATVRDEAAGLGSTIKQGLGDQVDQRKNLIADRLSAVADRAQRTADDLGDSEAWLGDLVARGARELNDVAEEIRRNDMAGILSSVEVFARRQPALFMGASVALGFAMTRIVAGGPSQADRYARTGRDGQPDRYGQAGRYGQPEREDLSQSRQGSAYGTSTYGAGGSYPASGEPKSSRPAEAPFVGGSNV